MKLNQKKPNWDELTQKKPNQSKANKKEKERGKKYFAVLSLCTLWFRYDNAMF